MTKSYDPVELVKRKITETSAKKAKFPKTAWLDDPKKFDRQSYVEETAQELLDVYGEMSDHDQRLVSMLADQIEIYVECSMKLKENGIIQQFNNGVTMGPSIAFTMRLKALDAAIKIMNELGLTLKARMNNKAKPRQEADSIDILLRGPKA